MKKTSLVLLTLFSLTSCLFDSLGRKKEKLSEDEFQTVKVGEYSMSIPNYMESTNSLNDEASLQYQNEIKETYIIVIDEFNEDVEAGFQELGLYDSSLTLLQNYRQVQMDVMKDGITISEITGPRAEKINEMDAEIVEIDGKAPEVPLPISYMIGFIQGPEKLYFITCWTMKSRKEKYQGTFEQMIRSFKATADTPGS